MNIDTTNIQEQICRLKYTINKSYPDTKDRFRKIEARVTEDIKTIESYNNKGESVIPEIIFSDIVKNKVDNKTIESIRRCGTVTVSYTHLRSHETRHEVVCRLLLEKKK